MKTNKEKIAIIGGGISGIATSVYLIEKGYKVDIYESKKNLGGRAGSINKVEKSVDIGQHVFLPSYKNFIEILEMCKFQKVQTNLKNGVAFFVGPGRVHMGSFETIQGLIWVHIGL